MCDKRNIILFHLESLNCINYRLNRRLFGCLQEIESKSMFFEKYYSTATSTIMTMADIAYGSQMKYEGARRIRWDSGCGLDDSIMNKLRNRGYKTDVIALSNDSTTIDIINDMSILGKDVIVDTSEDINEYHNRIERVLSRNDSFGLWICNFTSHVEINKCVSKSSNGLARWREGYQTADSEIEYLFNALKKRNLLKKTTIIIYGDHGDDIYSHGMHMGLVHAIEPCEQLIHTPLFVYDDRLDPCVCYNLVSTEDIASLVSLLVDSSQVSNEYIMSALNRRYVFSRNMYAGQRVKEKSFGKAYCLCDGEYLLSVSNKGMAMFNTETDPLCGNNLLRFFDNYNGILRKKDALSFRYHFDSIFDMETLDSIICLYNKMMPELKNCFENV